MAYKPPEAALYDLGPVLIVWGAMGYRVRAVSCSLLACFS